MQDIVLISSIDTKNLNDCILIPSKTDFQCNIFIDINVGQAKIKNVLLDYGSNRSITLSNEIFNTSKIRNSMSMTFVEMWVTRIGIIRISGELNREIAYSDSDALIGLVLHNVRIQSGTTVSISNVVLARFQVTIDWSKRNLYLTCSENTKDSVYMADFRLGESIEKEGFMYSQ